MKLIVTVQFEGTQATVAAVACDDWAAAEATQTYALRIAQVDKPVRGQPDLRALPCILQLLREHQLAPEILMLDGFVHLDAAETPGLGQHLHQALGGQVPVIGVSRKGLPGLTAQFEVLREDEAPPLWVTCAGIDIGAAKARVRAMHGRKRVPTLLKRVGRLAKGEGSA
jgi:deoxyribonuclease V